MKLNRYWASGLELLSVAFIVLKLCGVIKWSWWWVLSPIWLPVTLLVVFYLTLLSIFGASRR